MLPNEDDFYVFDQSLRGKTDVLIAVGSFRALENASRGLFSHVVMMDLDPKLIQFNLAQIELLKYSPTRRDFILNFIGNKNLFTQFPQLQIYFENSEFIKIAQFIETRLSDIMSGHPETHSIKFSYLQKIFELCDISRGDKAGFLISDERYQRLHQLAKKNRMASVNADLTKESFRKIASLLTENGFLVSVLDVSNAPDYFLYSVGNEIDSYRTNLAQIPFSENARLLFTTGLMPGTPKLGKWNYVSFPAKDYLLETGALIKHGSYSYFLYWPSTKERVVGPRQGLRCVHLF